MEILPRFTSLSYVLLFFPPFFWSTNFIVGKALAQKVPPWTLNTGRFMVSALILVPLLLFRREWPTLTRQSIAPVLLMSLTGVFAFNSVLYMGLRYTTAINATLVYNTLPLFAVILSVIF